MVDRRSFLRALGLGIGAVVAAPLVIEPEPVRRFWQVPASIGHGVTARVVSVKINGVEYQVADRRIYSAADADLLFGKESHLAKYIRDRFEYATERPHLVIPVGQAGEFNREIAEACGVRERVLWERRA